MDLALLGHKIHKDGKLRQQKMALTGRGAKSGFKNPPLFDAAHLPLRTGLRLIPVRGRCCLPSALLYGALIAALGGQWLGQKGGNSCAAQCHLMPSDAPSSFVNKALQLLPFGAVGLFSLIPEHNRRVTISFRPIADVSRQAAPRQKRAASSFLHSSIGVRGPGAKADVPTLGPKALSHKAAYPCC